MSTASMIATASTLPSSIPVLDPLCRAGILHVPVELTASTKGKQDWIDAAGCLMRDLSVCCLHQQQRCRAGVSCRQIHVDPHWMSEARRQQANVVSCCLSCGDSGSIAAITAPQTTAYAAAIRAFGVECPIAFTGAAASGMPAVVLRQLAATSGLVSYLNTALKAPAAVRAIDVPWSVICRLHLKDSCKYGKDCKNVHVCCKLGAGLLATAATNVNVAVPAAVALRRPSTAAVDGGLLNRVQPAAVVVHVAPAVPVVTQPPAPEPFKKAFRLDEGSLLMKDPDLADLVFNLPTLQSALSGDSRCDLFGLPSPADRSALTLTTSPCSTLRGGVSAMSPYAMSPLARGMRPRC